MQFNPNDTQYVKRNATIRSRHMIPMEMLAFLSLLVGGIVGVTGPGYLHHLLSENGKVLEWGLTLMPIGLIGHFASSAEWCLGIDWENRRLRYSIWLRMWLSGLAFIMWMISLYIMAALPGGGVTSMVVMAFFVSPFHLWSWWVNYRVHCALDPNMKTEKLGARLETSRDRW